MVQGKVGMWYDATSAADLLFDPKQNPQRQRHGHGVRADQGEAR